MIFKERINAMLPVIPWEYPRAGILLLQVGFRERTTA